MKKRISVVKSYVVLGLVSLQTALYADCFLPYRAIIGGVSDPTGSIYPAYAALVGPSGGLFPISLGIPSGSIGSVAINDFGRAIIGGRGDPTGNLFPAYAALVSPSGDLSPISLGIPNGYIWSVAINNFGRAIIGGYGDTTGSILPAYAALVSPSGGLFPIPLGISDGLIYSVAINNFGRAIIGGYSDPTGSIYPAYAALVDPSGDLFPISLGISNGWIFGVAINDSDRAIIGGYSDPTGSIYPAYAALVDSSGGLFPIPLGISDGLIYSVAINNFGQAIIGGNGDTTGNPFPAYAALVSPSGDLSPISLGIPSGNIWSVAINNFGRAIIGGRGDTTSNAPAYAALVSPSGDLSPISLGIPSGQIVSVAINNFGQAIIGGNGDTTGSYSPAYAALVSPSGDLFSISLGISDGQIASVSLLEQMPLSALFGNNRIFACYLNQYAPQDIWYFIPAFYQGNLPDALERAAPTRNAVSLFAADNNLLYLSHSLSVHLRNLRHFREHRKWQEPTAIAAHKDPLCQNTDCCVASIDKEVSFFIEDAPYFLKSTKVPLAQQKKFDAEQTQSTAVSSSLSERPSYCLWSELIGAFASQKEQRQTPGFDPSVGGIIIAFDANTNAKSLAGGGVAYTFTHIFEKEDMGYCRINQEYFFGYASWMDRHFYFDGVLWFGLFQIHQAREIDLEVFQFRSVSSPSGFQLSPHIEFGYDHTWTFLEDQSLQLIFDPFVMLDWVNAWQRAYQERGAGPFNAGQYAHYSSLLRTEAGLRFYQTCFFKKWLCTFEEKGAYANKTPFGIGKVSAFLVGSPGSFTVETLSQTQHLGVAEIALIVEPANHRYPYGSLSYQGEFSPSFQSHQILAEFSLDF